MHIDKYCFHGMRIFCYCTWEHFKIQTEFFSKELSMRKAVCSLITACCHWIFFESPPCSSRLSLPKSISNQGWVAVAAVSFTKLRAQTANHGIVEWLGLEGTSRIMKLQPPCCRQGHQPPHLILDQAAQGPIQSGLTHLPGRSIHSLSGQPIPARHHSPCKGLPPDIQPESSLLQL